MPKADTHDTPSTGRGDAPLSEESFRTAYRYDMLPFVIPTMPEGRNFWAPRPTGSYAFDCSLGERYAEAVLPLLREPDEATLLGLIVADILRNGDADRDKGVIVGMFHRIGRELEAKAGLSLAYSRTNAA